ncbi:Phosphatidylserine synthase 2, partial [Goodea atripinnis]
DITLRYKETRRRKQEAPVDWDRQLGNGSTAAASGRSKLNGSSETLRQRKS